MRLLSPAALGRFLLPNLVLFLVGCGSSDLPAPPGERLQVFPVQGEVAIAGQPVSGVRVFFTQLDGKKLTFNTVTDAHGKYAFSLYAKGDGLPPGKYGVRLTQPQDMVDDFEVETDKLKGRYNNPRLSAFSVEVKSQPNQISRFDLK
jgi:hypothetical protein